MLYRAGFQPWPVLKTLFTSLPLWLAFSKSAPLLSVVFVLTVFIFSPVHIVSVIACSICLFVYLLACLTGTVSVEQVDGIEWCAGCAVVFRCPNTHVNGPDGSLRFLEMTPAVNCAQRLSRTVYLFCFLWRCGPNAGHGLLILEVSRSHMTTHHSR